MTKISESQKRAVAYFNDHISWLISTPDKKVALARIRKSASPLPLARRLVRDYVTLWQTPVDYSAAQEARAAMICRQPEPLKSRAYYEDDLGDLDRHLAEGYLHPEWPRWRGCIDQATYDKKCKALARKEFPGWVHAYGATSAT